MNPRYSPPLALARRRRRRSSHLHLLALIQPKPTGRHVHTDLSLINVRTFNQRLSSLCRQRNVEQARLLFDQMPQKDLVTHSTMINLYLKTNNLPQALSLFARLPERNVVVDSAVLDGLSKAGRLPEARQLFDRMPERNVYSWTILVSGYCRTGEVGQARELFDRMPVRNAYSWTAMVLGYARSGMLGEARELFDRMPEKNVVSWTAMVMGYVECGRVGEARELFNRMGHRNLYSWNVMILGYLEEGRVGEAVELFESMPERNVVTWTSMVTGLARSGEMGKARELFGRMPVKDVAAWNAMIVVCAEEGLVNEVRELFDLMPKRNVVSWNAAIGGNVRNGFREEASRLFIEMLRSPSKPNEATLTTVLVAAESTFEVTEIHGLATLLGFGSDTSFGNALVTMYSRSGDLGSARLAFEELMVKDVVSWTSIIQAYSYHGCGAFALQAFARMLRCGAKPDGVAMVGVLSACSHAGLVGKGRKVFESMSRVYGLEPQAEHYACLVDLLGRAGLVIEAEGVVRTMPSSKRDECVLGALLGACRVHDKIEAAGEVGEELIKLEQAGSGGYVLLANAYASRGRWSDAARVRKTMKEKGVEKVPGVSSIEVGTRRHSFYVGDRSHPRVLQIYVMLDEVLLPHMKDVKLLQSFQSVHT
ncbi:pentatricopeptide repeat-containing protein-like [Iris pallida]|uniref:Pentatricopeptide repeat-containing protein-like n=1 Tax=Iris pallida TaxID=29817 RepID=A0AAX6HZR5_IRIPA|nr:pentatricopeptide repeat-containing protein-like [Iris pallida]